MGNESTKDPSSQEAATSCGDVIPIHTASAEVRRRLGNVAVELATVGSRNRAIAEGLMRLTRADAYKLIEQLKNTEEASAEIRQALEDLAPLLP